MKHLFQKSIRNYGLPVLLLCIAQLAQAQVKVGDNPTTIATSSMLEIESTTKALVPPRMTTTEMNAIASPLAGAVVYNTTLSCLHQYNGTEWKSLCTAYAPQVLSAVGTTASTISSGTADVPGATITVTVPTGETKLALITVTGYAIRSITAADQATQGVFALLQNSTKISSAYTTSVDGGDLINLPVPATIQSVVTLTAGTYVFKVQYTIWSEAVIVNYDPTTYAGYSGDSQSMKTRISALVLPSSN